MEVHIARQWESLIDEKVRAGAYRSRDEVVEEALRLLEQRDALLVDDGTWNEMIEEGWQAARRGELADGDQVFDRIERELS